MGSWERRQQGNVLLRYNHRPLRHRQSLSYVDRFHSTSCIVSRTVLDLDACGTSTASAKIESKPPNDHPQVEAS